MPTPQVIKLNGTHVRLVFVRAHFSLKDTASFPTRTCNTKYQLYFLSLLSLSRVGSALGARQRQDKYTCQNFNFRSCKLELIRNTFIPRDGTAHACGIHTVQCIRCQYTTIQRAVCKVYASRHKFIGGTYQADQQLHPDVYQFICILYMQTVRAKLSAVGKPTSESDI